MDTIPWEITLTVLGVVIPTVAGVYEFFFIGRKRLGYRIQMDTRAFGEDFAGARHPSLVLVRIENNGSVPVDVDDYMESEPVGLSVRFPRRRVVRAFDPTRRGPSSPTNAIPLLNRDPERADPDVLRLPRVPLNPNEHYKVLVVLDELDGDNAPERDGDESDAVMESRIKGGRITRTRYRARVSRGVVALITVMASLIVALYYVSEDNSTAAVDCASGKLTVVGSTAFRPVLEKAAASYREACREAPGDVEIDIRATGSQEGVRTLDEAGREAGEDGPAMLAFSDGRKGDGHPQLLPRPVSFSLFTLVVNEAAGVQDLTPEQIRRIYAGRYRNWSEVGGNDLPIALVGRYSNSGSRRALEERVLGGATEPNVTSHDCRARVARPDHPALRCERGSTQEALDTVAAVPGGLGYAEAHAAGARTDRLRLVRIDGHPAELDAADRGVYPFWATEYAYTYGQPPADSLVAGFLRYMTLEVGQDVIREYGQRPCADLANPRLCRPS
jgi:ABC-type phosphate transport system substrate-binding protein